MFLKLRNLASLRMLELWFFLAIAFGMFPSEQLYAQSAASVNDSLVTKELQSFILHSDSIRKIEDLIYDAYDHQNDTLRSLAYSELFLERGKKEKNLAIQYFSNYQIAFLTYELANYKQAIRHANSSLKIAEKLQDTIGVISSNTMLGNSLYVLGYYNEALESYIRAKDLYKQMQDDSYILCLVNIANIRVKLNHYDDALNDYTNVLTVLDMKNEDSFIAYVQTYLSALLGKSLCLNQLKKFDEAETTCYQGIKFSEAKNMLVYTGCFYVNLGVLYYEREIHHTSLGFLKQGREILLANEGLQNNIFTAEFYIAKNYFAQEKYDEAIVMMDAIFDRITDDANTDRIEEMYQFAIDVSKILNNQEKQLLYHDRFQKIVMEKNQRQIQALDLLHENDTNEYKIENERLSSENIKNLSDKKNVLAISIALIVILLLIFLLHYRNSKRKEQKFLTIIEAISEQTSAKTKETTAPIKNEKARAILEELEALEETQFYLSQEATLHSTAKLLNTNTTYLSKALNDVKKQSFSQYLNKLRIDYVLVRLKEDAVFRSYTIHAISTEIGYKSATTFIKEFKHKTGLNPSYYIKKIDE